jgi:hypothetical protein
LLKGLFPARDRRCRSLQGLDDAGLALAIGQCQDQTRAEYVTGRGRPRRRPLR